MYEISYQTVFAASHAIRLPDGSLEPMHGHNWHVTVIVSSEQLDDIETVMDFHDLEKIVTAITQPMHNRNLNETAPFAGAQGQLAINPTAERVAWWIGSETARQLPEQVALVSATVTEAPGCAATWRP